MHSFPNELLYLYRVLEHEVYISLFCICQGEVYFESTGSRFDNVLEFNQYRKNGEQLKSSGYIM